MSITSTKTQELKFPVLAEHADAIRRLSKQTVENIIEIGRRLVDFRPARSKSATFRLSLARSMWTRWCGRSAPSPPPSR